MTDSTKQTEDPKDPFEKPTEPTDDSINLAENTETPPNYVAQTAEIKKIVETLYDGEIINNMARFNQLVAELEIKLQLLTMDLIITPNDPSTSDRFVLDNMLENTFLKMRNFTNYGNFKNIKIYLRQISDILQECTLREIGLESQLSRNNKEVEQVMAQTNPNSIEQEAPREDPLERQFRLEEILLKQDEEAAKEAAAIAAAEKAAKRRARRDKVTPITLLRPLSDSDEKDKKDEKIA